MVHYASGMAPQSRIVLPGMEHPVTQLGNCQRDVFFVDGDRRLYRSYLKEGVARYCLPKEQGQAQAKRRR